MGLLNKKDLASSAEVVDKHLILSLPNATEPVVWRMALDKIGTAAFEVKPVKTSDAYKLVLKPTKGSAETIAPFSNREEALQALICASNALQRPEATNSNKKCNHSNTQKNNVQNSSTQKNGHKWLYLFIGFLAVIGLYIYMTTLIPKKIDTFGSNKTENGASSSQTGVPLSADDFLNGL